jgi:hypothetical protein
VDAIRVREARVRLQGFLERFGPQGGTEPSGEVLGTRALSRKTLEAIQARASETSRRWGILSELQTQDFIEALHAARLAR